MTVIYVNGCWDLFHYGHLRRIQGAAALGNFLVVGVAEDEYILSYKHQLPIFTLKERMAIVAALRCVDAVMPYWGPGDMRPMQKYHATVRVVGPEFGERSAQRVARAEHERLGIRFVVVPRTPDISTTLMKEKCHAEIAKLAEGQQ